LRPKRGGSHKAKQPLGVGGMYTEGGVEKTNLLWGGKKRYP